MRIYTDRFILTPGPTEVPHRVRAALMRETTNPDLDPEFLGVYEETRGYLKKLIGAHRSSLYVAVGEAMLGLEAAIANTIRKGDRVVVVSNGVFGEGFSDLVRSYGGTPVGVGGDWRRSVDLAELDSALQRNRDAVAVTLVHCDTPSALLNDLPAVARVVRSYGALLIVDAVSSIGALPIDFDSNGIDIIVGGSQKVLNTPPGLTVMAISSRAWERIDEVGYPGFYLSLRVWRDMLDGHGVFPYTMSDALVYAINESLKMLFEEGLESVFKRHEAARSASWRALEAMGLEPYPAGLEHSSPTVTAFLVPRGVDEGALRERMWVKYGVMIAGSWGRLQGKVLRVGHMGVQASRTHLLVAYTALCRALCELGYRVSVSKAVEAIEGSF